MNRDDNRLVDYDERGKTDFIVHLGNSGSVKEVVEDDAGGIWVEWVDEKSACKQWLRVDLESGARSTIPVSDRLFLKEVVDASRVIAVHLDAMAVQTVRVLEIAP